MSGLELADSLTIIDGLVISRWSREVFEDMHRGGVTAANCTCCVWEDFRRTMENVAQWKSWFKEHDDILLQVYSTDDIRRAKQDNKVGIVLSWQNTSAIEDRVDFLPIFHELGIRVVQLTYNTQNFVASGCWESRDGGLSDFGRDVVDQLNALRILIDLSHVGPVSAREAIEYSKLPVAFTHCCPMALKDYARNKTDEELHHIVDHGGFVGFATYPRFLPKGQDTTVEDCVDALEYMVQLLGEDHVGIGTDFTQDQPVEWFDWLRRDKGIGSFRVPGRGTGTVLPKGLSRLSEYPNLVAALDRRGWSEGKIRKVMGENWLGFLKEVWGA